MTTDASSSTSSSDDDLISVGRVGRPHGLDGSFHVTAPEPDALAVGRRLHIAGREAEIQRRAGTDSRPIVRLSGCATRDAAEALRGAELEMRRGELPGLEAGEFWADDLVGCGVFDGDRRVGSAVRLIGLPSCEVLEVEREAGGTLLVPLVADAVRSVDVAGGRVEVDLAFLGED